jgi:hypothetical protein
LPFALLSLAAAWHVFSITYTAVCVKKKEESISKFGVKHLRCLRKRDKAVKIGVMKGKAASEAARLLSSLRKTLGGGRPKVMRKCAGCGERFSAREMRKHVPLCPGPAWRAGSRKRRKISGGTRTSQRATTARTQRSTGKARQEGGGGQVGEES